MTTRTDERSMCFCRVIKRTKQPAFCQELEDSFEEDPVLAEGSKLLADMDKNEEESNETNPLASGSNEDQAEPWIHVFSNVLQSNCWLKHFFNECCAMFHSCMHKQFKTWPNQ